MYVPAKGPGNGWVFPTGGLEQLQGSKLCLLSWALRKLLPGQYFLYNTSNFQIFMHMSDTCNLDMRNVKWVFSAFYVCYQRADTARLYAEIECKHLRF